MKKSDVIAYRIFISLLGLVVVVGFLFFGLSTYIWLQNPCTITAWTRYSCYKYNGVVHRRNFYITNTNITVMEECGPVGNCHKPCGVLNVGSKGYCAKCVTCIEDMYHLLTTDQFSGTLVFTIGYVIETLLIFPILVMLLDTMRNNIRGTTQTENQPTRDGYEQV